MQDAYVAAPIEEYPNRTICWLQVTELHQYFAAAIPAAMPQIPHIIEAHSTLFPYFANTIFTLIPIAEGINYCQKC